MAISGVYNSLTNQMSVKVGDEESKEAAARKQSGKEERTLDDVTFSSMGDRLSAMVRTSPTTNVLDGLQAQMQSMREVFLNTVNKRLEDEGLSEIEDFSLRKDEEGNIVVAGDHEHADAIEQLFKDDPQLVKAYNQIAEMTEMGFKTAHNPQVMRARTGLAAYLAQTGDDMFGGSFQMLLSGSATSMQTFWN